MRGARTTLRRTPFDVLIVVAALMFAFFAIAWPFWVARYPPMTDLPFHAAETSIFRHYFDASWHFREQFELHPMSVPYVSSYLLGAFFMLFFSPVTAVKMATVLMLSALPLGLATLAWGMRKSPLLGMAALPFVWCDLTHWGFVNFVSALGMFAAAVGLAIRVVDRPTTRSRVALSLVLVLLFFTHVFRFPFAIAAVVGAGVVLFPVTRRLRPLALPLVPALSLFAIFWWVRPPVLGGSMGPLVIHPERADEIRTALVNGFSDAREMASAQAYLRVLALVAALSLAFGASRLRQRSRSEWGFVALSTIAPLASAIVFLWLYFTLPMEIGLWWYVYPREVTAAAFVSLACLPDLPRSKIARAFIVGALGVASLGVTHVVADNYAQFGKATADFEAITERIPKSPKLLYLVFDHSGTRRTNTPFIHLPAYVQAEKGGWLSFHFAIWGATPAVYRSGEGAVVPPPVPLRWEWTPEKFDVKKNGAFFDWFLVRAMSSPDHLLLPDPSIQRVAHVGTWWLYERVEARAPEEGQSPDAR